VKYTKLLIIGLFVALLASHVVYAGVDQGQEKKMEAYMKIMAVNENHSFLKNFEGKWDVNMTAWMQPGAEPTETQSSGESEMILGGRFLKVNVKGLMFGQPYEGQQILGYDNFKEKFISFWIDSSSTAFYLMEGTFDKEKKAITDVGSWDDPMTGGTIKVRAVTTLVNENEYTYQMFMVGPDGNEFKSMEYRAIRKN
jgi:hypothetical protein